MTSLTLSNFRGTEEAIEIARAGPYGNTLVQQIQLAPNKFAPGTQRFYTFTFDSSCPWQLVVKITPNFTRLFSFVSAVKPDSPIVFQLPRYVPGYGEMVKRPTYSIVKYDKVTSSEKLKHIAEKHKVWRDCLMLDVYLSNFLKDKGLLDIAPVIRKHLAGDIWVPPQFGKAQSDESYL